MDTWYEVDFEHKANDKTPANSKETHAYLVGGGIASLAAATYLIRDA